MEYTLLVKFSGNLGKHLQQQATRHSRHDATIASGGVNVAACAAVAAWVPHCLNLLPIHTSQSPTANRSYKAVHQHQLNTVNIVNGL
jgi:hypothetical protein